MEFPHQTEQHTWEIKSPSNMEVFIDAITLFDDSGKIAFMEDTIWNGKFDIVRVLAIPPKKVIKSGIISPPPENIHLIINSETRSALKQYIRESGYINLCSHFHIYDNKGIIMEWFDTLDLPILLSREINENVVKKFAEIMNTSYSRIL
jgi:hypothetical protein